MPVPGWYEDPTDPAMLRMWDGQRWTNQVRPASDPALGGYPAISPPPSNAGKGSPGTRRGRGRRAAVVVGLLLVVVAGTGAGVYLAGSSSGTLDDAATNEILLEPVGSPGPDPFMASVAATGEVSAGEGVDGVVETDAVQRLAGDTPGLYGGSGDLAVCDVALLVDTLQGDDRLAEAFAAVLGIDPGGIDEWTASLVAVTLREDTRVTNHGYADGSGVPFQSVLQSGTAVLVNNLGLPVVRCACGNPLIPPTQSQSASFSTGPDVPWPSFSSDRLVTVGPAPAPLEVIKVADPDSGDIRPEPVGAGGLVLLPDGLGLVSVGDSTSEVVDTLTALLGPPTHTSSDVSIEGGLFRSISWRSLSLTFQVPDTSRGERNSPNRFVSYRFGPWPVDENGLPSWHVSDRGDDGSWDPAPWEQALATAEGIRINSDGDLANRTYPDTYLYRDYLPTDEQQGMASACAVVVPHSGLDPSPGMPINDQLIGLNSNREGLFFAPLEGGRVRGIGGGSLCR